LTNNEQYNLEMMQVILALCIIVRVQPHRALTLWHSAVRYGLKGVVITSVGVTNFGTDQLRCVKYQVWSKNQQYKCTLCCSKVSQKSKRLYFVVALGWQKKTSWKYSTSWKLICDFY